MIIVKKCQWPCDAFYIFYGARLSLRTATAMEAAPLPAASNGRGHNRHVTRRCDQERGFFNENPS